MAQTLTNRIDKLIDDLGINPKPGPVDIRNRLTAFRAIAEALESGQSALEADAQIKALETEVEKLKAENQAEKERLNAQLQYAESQRDDLKRLLDATSAEIEAIKEEREEDEPLSTIEAKVLYFLDGKGDAYALGITEAVKPESHWMYFEGMLNRMVESGFLHSEEEPGDVAPRYFLTKKAKAWVRRDQARNREAF